jgi:hypothetical protein
MKVYKVQPWHNGTPVGASYEKVEGVDEVDAATRLLKMPLQRKPRHNMYLRAMVHKPGKCDLPVQIYAAE